MRRRRFGRRAGADTRTVRRQVPERDRLAELGLALLRLRG